MKKFVRLYIDSYKGLSQAAWLLAIVMLINRAGSMVLPFLGMYMSSQLGFTKPQIGMVLGFYGLGSVIGSLAGGWLTDRFGSFKIQTASMIAAVPLYFGLSLFKDFVGFSCAIFVLTTIIETFRPANSVSVMRYAKPENLTRAYSLNRMAVNLGFSIGPAMGGFLASYSYDWIFYGNSIACGTAAIAFYIFFRNRKERTPAKDQPKPTNTDAPHPKDPHPMRDTVFMMYCGLCFLFAVAFFQLISTLPLYYKEVHLLSEKSIGLLLGFSGFVIVVFEMVLIHSIEHKYNARQVVVIGAVITGISYCLLNFHYGMIWLFFAMFVLSMGEMLILPFTSTITALRAPQKLQGAYMGINAMAFSAANIFSPFLGTYTAENFSYTVLWFITAGIIFSTAIGFHFVLSKMKLS